MYTTLASTAVSAYPTATSTSLECPSCYFGATAASLHSFPYTIVATVIAIFQPYVFVYDDGCAVTSTCVESIYPQGLTSAADIAIFSNPADMTWTTSNVAICVLSYPTTYVEYLGFEKDSFVSQRHPLTTRGFCAGQIETTAIELPTPTTAASFIYPLEGPLISSVSQNTSYISVVVPTPLIDYLEQIAGGSYGGTLDIKSCSALPKYFVPATIVSSTCYTTHSTLSSTTTAEATSTSTYGYDDETTTITSSAIIVSVETLTVVNCDIAVGHKATTNNFTNTINDKRAWTQSNTTLPTLTITETRSSFTDRVAAMTTI